MNEVQFEKLSGYFIDLAKVWFASGVIGFFIDISSSNPKGATYIMLIGGFILSAAFLTLGIRILKNN